MRAIDAMQREIGRLEHDLELALRRGGDQVAGQLGLAIDDNGLAGQRLDIDADHLVPIGEVEAVLDHGLAVHPFVQPQPVHEVGGHRLEHPCADAALDMIAARAFEQHAIDAFRLEQMAEQQPGGARSDDRDLGAARGHASNCCSSSPSTR